MNPRLRYAPLGLLSIYWLSVVYTILDILKLNQNIYPRPVINQIKIAELLVSSLLLLVYIIKQVFHEYRKDHRVRLDMKKMVSFLLFASISAPIVFGYVYDQDIQSIGQMIIDLGTAVMDEDFDTTPPGEDPPGWEEDRGDWYTVDDGGNNVYYQNDDGDKEALSISTTGNTSWTDYSFLVDLKFDTGPSNKQGLCTCYR